MSSDQSILDRLAELERKDAAKTDEMRRFYEQRQRLEDKVLKLESDNMDLKRQIFNNEKENHKLQEALALIQTGIRNHAELINQMRTTIFTLSPKTDETPETKKCLKRICALEHKTEGLSKNACSILQNAATLSNNVKTLATTINNLSGLQKVLNRALVNRQNTHDLEKQVDDLTMRTHHLETIKRKRLRSITSVYLWTERDLPKYTHVKLDQYRDELLEGGIFNKDSCSLVPECEGPYVIVLQAKQKESGEIKVWLNWDGCGLKTGHFVGMLDGDDDLCCGALSLYLKRGQQVWVQVERRKSGKAFIAWCRLMCWLLGE